MGQRHKNTSYGNETVCKMHEIKFSTFSTYKKNDGPERTSRGQSAKKKRGGPTFTVYGESRPSSILSYHFPLIINII
jgi:hypothetical protein